MYHSRLRELDCDCRAIGYCPAGPPPTPPIWEFLDMLPDDTIPPNSSYPSSKPHPENWTGTGGRHYGHGTDSKDQLDTPRERSKEETNASTGTHGACSASYASGQAKNATAVPKKHCEKPPADNTSGGNATATTQLAAVQTKEPAEKEIAFLKAAASLFPFLSDAAQAGIYQHFGGTEFFGTQQLPDYWKSKNQTKHDVLLQNFRIALSTLLYLPKGWEDVREEIVGPHVLRCTLHALEKITLQKDYLFMKANTQLPTMMDLEIGQCEIKILAMQKIAKQVVQKAAPKLMETSRLKETELLSSDEMTDLCEDVWSNAEYNVMEEEWQIYTAKFEDSIPAIRAQIWGYELHVPTLRIAAVEMKWGDKSTRDMLWTSFGTVGVGMSYLALSLRALPGVLG